MLKETPFSIRTKQPLQKCCTNLWFVLCINRLRFFNKFLVSMSELALVSVATRLNLYPILAHLSFIFCLICFQRSSIDLFVGDAVHHSITTIIFGIRNLDVLTIVIRLLAISLWLYNNIAHLGYLWDIWLVGILILDLGNILIAISACITTLLNLSRMREI